MPTVKLLFRVLSNGNTIYKSSKHEICLLTLVPVHGGNAFWTSNYTTPSGRLAICSLLSISAIFFLPSSTTLIGASTLY